MYSVIHLEDEKSYRTKLKGSFPRIRKALIAFFKENFKLKVTSNSIMLHQSGNCEELRGLLLTKSDNRPTSAAAGCLFFLLDYYVPEGPVTASSGSLGMTSVQTLTLDQVMLDQVTVRTWLDAYFPAIPKVVLTQHSGTTVGDVQRWEYLNKGILDNPDEFCNKLAHYFEQWWQPSFWRKLREYATTQGATSWHTPGHNGGNAFKQSPLLESVYDQLGPMVFRTDLSVSVKELGDLSEPVAPDSAKVKVHPLDHSQRRGAAIFGSAETYFITNGTSTSNKAMLMTLLRPGDVVLLDRNCHKSVHQAVVMSGAWPVYLPPTYNRHLGVWAPISMDAIERYLEHDYSPDLKPKMLVLTTCTYEGVLYPTRKISQLCEKHGILFYADEAWASYLRFHPYYVGKDDDGSPVPFDSLGGGAHFAVHSTHKTLAAFSQASMIHVSQRFFDRLTGRASEWEWLANRFALQGRGSAEQFRHELLETLRYWHSTSPHYPMIATLDCAGVQMRIEGFQAIGDRIAMVEEFGQKFDWETNGCVVGLKEIIGDVTVGCSPKTDPVVMRVSTARKGKETRDEQEWKKAAFAGADRE